MIKKLEEPTGLKKVIEAMWEYVPQLLLWIVLGLALLIGKLWVDIHDMRIDVNENIEKLSSAKLCEHITLCTAPITSELRNSINRIAISTDSHMNATESLRIRLLSVEDKIYNLKRDSTNSSALETRVESLEKKIKK